MAKLDIDIILIDESVVDWGFRVLMSGYQGEQFERNPVLLLQHKRVDDGYSSISNDIVLPMGKWFDIKVEGQALTAKTEFDDDDDFAIKIQNKVKKGYYNAASIWIDPIEVSDDDKLKLPGQSGPTITKWGIREASIVDIPNCRNSLAIRNSAGKKILLSGSSDEHQPEVLKYLKSLLPNQKNDMDRKLLCAQLDLPETATDSEINQKLAAIKSEANKLSGVTTEVTTLRAKVVELNTAADTAKIEGLVDGAINAKKLAAGDRDKYIKLAKADFDTTKEVLDGMKAYESIEQRLSGGGGDNAAELAELLKLSGDELYHKEGSFERLQQLSPEVFKLKYKEFFKVEYKG